jgi:hypothetical protein
LRLYGFTAETADSLGALLCLLRTTHADVVVTEVFGDPVRTCRAIRDVAPDVMIAFHTTRGHPALVGQMRALGCGHFLKATNTAGLFMWLAGRRVGEVGRGATVGSSTPGVEPCEILSDPRSRWVGDHPLDDWCPDRTQEVAVAGKGRVRIGDWYSHPGWAPLLPVCGTLPYAEEVVEAVLDAAAAVSD